MQILGLSGIFFDAVLVFAKNFSLLSILDLVIL